MTDMRRVLFGRQRGRPLSPHRRRLMDDLYPALRLDPGGPAPARLADLFEADVDTVVLEIGFGGGEHLIAGADAHPRLGFIGVEPFLNGLARAVAEVDRLGLANVRLYGDDAGPLMDWLPDASLNRIDLLYPDPWPKRRHHKRRFVSTENLDRAARVLAPGGAFRVATDIPAYAEWTLLAFRRHPAFRWTARRADDWRKPFPDWPGTRYEAKALTAGRTPAYFHFARV